MAAANFACDRDAITFEVIKDGESTGVWQILALYGTPEEINKADAGFATYYEAEGVYLEMYAARGGGEPLNRTALALHISRKNISGLDMTAVQALAASPRGGRARIAPPQQEHKYGEDITIEINRNESEAWAKLLAPEPGGLPMGLEAAKKKVEAAGVLYGLNEQALKELIGAKVYNEPRLIAEAAQPEDGENGKLIFHFSTDERTGRPREIGGGRVDYRSLDLYVPVTEGQLLVSRKPATEGKPGATVKGKVVKQRPGKEVILPKGKNVDINAEKTEMRSKSSGMVEYIKGSINVSNVYNIDGDCDLGIGNIDFDGSVHISGSVRTGHVIKATGGVIVGGGVEGATIIAGGNVEIKNGMQGADKGRIEAGGAVSMMYIERGTVIAEGPITVDACVHSTIETGGSMYAKGHRGCIIGGHTSAAGDIVAKTIGSIANTRTEIEVGAMPKKRDRIQFLENEIERLTAETTKLNQLDAYLNSSKEKMNHETWEKLYLSGVENRRLNKQSMEECSNELNDLKYELEHATEGKVHVFETVHPGTRITIASDMYKVNDDIQFATFRYKDGQVVYGTCELKKE